MEIVFVLLQHLTTECQGFITFTTSTSDYKNHMILDDTNVKENNYISNMLDSCRLSPVNNESLGEILLP